LFTAIIRDLSEEVEEASANEVTEVMCRWKIEKSAKVISLNKKLQDYVGVTTKEEELYFPFSWYIPPNIKSQNKRSLMATRR